MPDEKGTTRRERNERFGDIVEPAPPVDVPLDGWFLWEWFWTISSRLRRVRDGVCEPIPPTEFQAWCRATDTIVYPVEYGILSAMDDKFCEEMNRELKDYRTRQEEAQKQEMEAARRSGGRGRRK